LSLVRSDDLMPSESFAQFSTCFNLYRGLFTNMSSREIHIFPAEQNAAYYERRMPRLLRQNYRILRPEVVSLLEDRLKFELFFRAYALGFVAKMEGERNGVRHRFWGYKLPEHNEPIYLTSISLENVAPSYFDVIKNFIIGRDKRDGYDDTFKIDWMKLRQAIERKKQELGNEKTAEFYDNQLEPKPESIIQAILSERQDDAVLNANEEYYQQVQTSQQKYQDLADLAKYIYTYDREEIKGGGTW